MLGLLCFLLLGNYIIGAVSRIEKGLLFLCKGVQEATNVYALRPIYRRIIVKKKEGKASSGRKGGCLAFIQR